MDAVYTNGSESITTQKDGNNLPKNYHDDRYRRYFSQFLAVSVDMMLIFQFGQCVSFTGVVIGALSGKSSQNETLHLTADESSWFGSMVYVCQPFGSLLSIVTTEYLGRKIGMMISTIPYGIAWVIMYQASEVWHLFLANALMGLSIGLMEGPIMTFVGEVCEPVTRSIFISYGTLGTSFGTFMVFFLNTVVEWRTVALVCLCVPILNFIALFFIPETPHWLITKGRIERAEKSLKWLRGWTTKERVADEFQEIQPFVERSKWCDTCIEQNQHCPHPAPTLVDKLAEFKRKRTLKPFFIVITLFAILQYSGTFAMTPYVVNIFKAYGSPLPADVTTAILGLSNIFATVTFISLEHFVGKRRIYLTVLAGICVTSLVISVYGFVLLPRGYNSFDINLAVPELPHPGLVYIPTTCLIVWSFCSFCGIYMMPWQLLSEIFAFKTRGAAAGISASINYIMAFSTVITYYNLETTLSLPGVSLFYFIVSTLGLILMFSILPETENRSLEDIERHYSDDSKRLSDWRIPKHVKASSKKHANLTEQST